MQHFHSNDRVDIHCFGDDSCYPLAFGIPTVVLLIGTIILAIGKNYYIKQPPSGSIVAKVINSIGVWHASICLFVCLFVLMDVFPEEGKWISHHQGFCLKSKG